MQLANMLHTTSKQLTAHSLGNILVCLWAQRKGLIDHYAAVYMVIYGSINAAKRCLSDLVQFYMAMEQGSRILGCGCWLCVPGSDDNCERGTLLFLSFLIIG